MVMHGFGSAWGCNFPPCDSTRQSSRTASALASLCPFFPQTQARERAVHVRKIPNPTRSEGRCCAIAADAPRTTLERSVELFDGDDEDLSSGLEICSVPQFVNDDG